MKNTIYLLAFVMLAIHSCSDKIEVCNQLPIVNASFEIGLPEQDSVLALWTHEADEFSTPDLFFSNDSINQWGVRNSAHSGDRYIGLVTRAEGTKEHVTQRLANPVQNVVSVSFELWTARSEVFKNFEGIVEELSDFTQPVKLLVSIINEDGDRCEIYKSDLLKNKDWRLLIADAEYCGAIHGVELTATYDGGESYNGHVLLDDVNFIICKQ